MKKQIRLGSKTNGLQNYDDLYADVLLWAREGWIDYNIPQIYWEIGHSRADYETLVKWWAKNSENPSTLYWTVSDEYGGTCRSYLSVDEPVASQDGFAACLSDDWR